MPLRKYLSGLPVLPVRTSGPRPELPVEPDRKFRYVFILNLTFRFRTDLSLDWFLDVGNLENKS
jgi:hypothetical protein